ncbi:MogA/MoaB family molybdenum cofactor biosynthesis protein [Natranaeroarchaeum aerophilus]|uniref:MogA/MoaB family molybdenum cofactor biosynthesis protein n=1 Tax=Natranaeroarchaeum aerophilus TaxID=2917711 RepID=A0AAE3FRJ7_9EURY|nr:MogA/MoaB family molybdenum cofactor biosynthesis protein [Natranaeroarchaeum aerophilus]MCL9813543.1 MogA/MoaB family molybdenum cofactor biosynthesis protein [Natranaeroarchaeum aerophilus]
MTGDHVDRSRRRSTDNHSHDVIDPLYVAVVTVSTSRYDEHNPADALSTVDDPGGDTAVVTFESAGHRVTARALVPDDADRIEDLLESLLTRQDVDTIITTGGTGVTADDVTPDAVQATIDRRLRGFGELFRMLSYEEVGTRAMASRALAGIADGVPIFCLPGSASAVELATETLIVPETPHLAGLATRHQMSDPAGRAIVEDDP